MASHEPDNLLVRELSPSGSTCESDNELTESVTESSAAGFASVSDLASSSSSSQVSKTLACHDKSKFKENWKEKYLMWPNEAEGYMTCIVYSEKLTSFKVSTMTRHIDRKHKGSKHYLSSKKQRLITSFVKSLTKQQQTLRKAVSPSQLQRLAPYKLAFTLASHKMPFSACEAFTTFAHAADPDSVVFKNIAGSRNTIATKTLEIFEKVLKPELTQKITDSPFWSLMADDSTDSAVQEQCGVLQDS